MAVCAETLTPFLAECGGKDAVIVTADADLDAAADAIVWGALSNAGQTCAGGNASTRCVRSTRHCANGWSSGPGRRVRVPGRTPPTAR